MPHSQPGLTERILEAAAAGIGGRPREGQRQMAAAIGQAITEAGCLLVQAGTGTGKSLAYLAPAAAFLAEQPEGRVVVATATLALQTQLATKDIPTVVAATAAAAGRDLVWCLLKGRSNYACLLRVRDQTGVDSDQGELLAGSALAAALRSGGADQASVLGAEVVALRQWAEAELEAGGSGDRDDAPSCSAKAWSQVAVSSRECVGAPACPYISDCFAEAARDRARRCDLVVTNHALVAVDAERGGGTLPDHDLVVFDEAHELPARVTGAASTELSPQSVERAVRRAGPWLSDDVAEVLAEAAASFRRTLEEASPGRVTSPEGAVVAACAQLRAAFRQALTGLGQSKSEAERVQAAAVVQEVYEAADRMAALSPADVLWVSAREVLGCQLVIAPLSVAGLIRNRLLAGRAAVLTSATLALGGSFTSTAISLGLSLADKLEASGPADGVPPGGGLAATPAVAVATGPADAAPGDGPAATAAEPSGGAPGDRPAVAALPWRALDVGSPFDYPKQGIAYVASHLPPPGRDGISEPALLEIGELLEAAGGHSLGLFSSLRAAQAAAAWVRASGDLPVLCQGEGHLPDLVRRFLGDPVTSLFGTISLWQGVDAPGATCRLVLIDRVPFPRPDEPLVQARQEAVARRGGNGFMEVAASQAALLLAQGAGRLIRSQSDRGVVAILDRRLSTARYGGFLVRSLPPFWLTTDRAVALAALRRLRAEAALD